MQKITSKIHQKTRTPKTLNLIPKGCQDGAQIDANIHQKSMPTLVKRRKHENHKNHVSLNENFIQNHCKNNCLKGLAGCACKRKRYPKNVFKQMIHNFYSKSMQNRYNSHARKVMQQTTKIIDNGNSKGYRKLNKSHQNAYRENYEKPIRKCHRGIQIDRPQTMKKPY